MVLGTRVRVIHALGAESLKLEHGRSSLLVQLTPQGADFVLARLDPTTRKPTPRIVPSAANQQNITRA